MEKRKSKLEHGQPMDQTRGLLCTCDSGVARCQSQRKLFLANEFDVQSVIAWASELGRCQSNFV